MRKKKETEVL